MSYQHRSLTAAIDEKNSPLRQYFDRRFPNVKAIQTEYRKTAGTLMVNGTASVSAGTVGAAFDFLLRFTFDANYIPQIAVAAPPISGSPEHIAAVLDVMRVAGAAASRPLSPPSLSNAIRASWALALTTEVYRNPLVIVNSPLADLLRTNTFTPDHLLALAPEAAVEQIRAMYMLAIVEFADYLSPPPTALALGPTFAASHLCAADADIIVDGVLFELKTRLGAVNRKTGQRADSLSSADLYQIIGYVLFDTPDAHRLHTVALYSARYGALHKWDLTELLNELAGEPIDLAAERTHVWQLLSADGPAQ